MIADRVVNDVAPKDRDIAMVFQSYALYPHMSVYDNMAFGLKLRKTPKEEIKRRVGIAADILGIGNLLDRKPRQLSGGQRQRVAVGRAIVREPKVFLFDEPLSNLDAKLRVETRANISKLHQQLQTTFIYVTHDQVEAMTLGDRLVVMDNGYAAQIGSPLEVYERPANMFVAGFIGSPAMNFMEVTIQEGGQALKLPGDIQIPLNGSALPGWAGKKAILGIRPEHMELDSKGPPTILVTVGQVELLGADTLVHGHIGAQKVSLTVRLPDVHRFEKHATIRLSISQEKLHLFDPETKKRLD
jgi:sn-glycerol 3-phosphate transport system ATP-binding protein